MSSAFALTMTPTSSPPTSRVASRRGSVVSINRPPLVNRGSTSVAGSRASSPQRPVNPESEFIGSIDCGTSSCRFYIFDQYANVICWHQKEFEQLHIEPGWHEHDPLTYTKCIDACIVQTLKEFQELGYKQSMIKGVGIAVQRETTLVWDRTTGKPLHNAIAWPDARNAATVRALKERAASVTFNTPDGDMKGEDAVRVITGLPFRFVARDSAEFLTLLSSPCLTLFPSDSTYFSATKYAWLLENCKEVQEAKENGNLMIGTVDAWLLWNYTGGVKTGKHITDLTNASRTLLLSLHTQQWDDQLLDFFDLPRSALPTLASNSEDYGQFFEGHILEGIPIAGLVGDQQAALVGNKCLEKGSAKQTYGTGCFMLYNTGSDIVKSTHGLLTTVGYKAGPNAQIAYALEGSVAVGGSSVQWYVAQEPASSGQRLRDNLGLIKNAKEAGELAEEVEDTGGVYFVTGFSGLFAPYWDMAATGMLIGLSTYTTKHHICRATLEATCFQTRAILEAMTKDTQGHASPEGSVSNGRDDGDSDDEADFKPKAVGAGSMKALKVDGGMTSSDVTMQLQADILGIRVERPTMRESTALGAALLAGSALNLFGWDLEDPSTLRKVNEFGMELFMPSIDAQEREWKFAGWNRAVNRAMAWKNHPPTMAIAALRTSLRRASATIRTSCSTPTRVPSHRSFWSSASSTATGAASAAASSSTSSLPFLSTFTSTFSEIPSIAPDVFPLLLAVLLTTLDEDDPSSSLTPPWTVLPTSSGSGYGAFASSSLNLGQLLIAERPLCIWPQGLSEQEAQKLFDRLTDDKKKVYLSLAGEGSKEGDGDGPTDRVRAVRATNGFGIELPESGGIGIVVGMVFPKIASEQSRMPQFRTLRMEVYPLTSIAPSSEITIEYLPLITQSRAQRQKTLQSTFGFSSCLCPLCTSSPQEMEASDLRRAELSRLAKEVKQGGRTGDRKGTIKRLERMRVVLLEEGYEGMPEFEDEGVSNAYAAYRTMRISQGREEN
ncbi:BZ3500_MvSof-1268-A1-R1_Chr8-2g10237 [Microbotryum saponariae]|uniref:glycerol kinase n=1 Tax=Microbotryum saponariae TaxID=289078 RepID=A0A2X0KVS0_9BASI|nr:BZ3500_MvSof-1268-A1-R1_Chr8-2g10237 [Microbotryum saponariae]SDA02035.1 BZ3501_MvSof-1269-A2-R1_Chr8-2g09987 [Microbotryum saponariae]